jgi:GNAT superfamily N-acetyltransferase
MDAMSAIRPCRIDEIDTLVSIINSAALAYRGVIPPECWHEPYMSTRELARDLDSGVEMWGLELNDRLVGVMGAQNVKDVQLIRHAYVLPGQQRHGVGAALIAHLRGRGARRTLVGTWAAATWAIAFYRHHGFDPVPEERRVELLQTYWSIPARQMASSIVLASANCPAGI